MAVVTVTADGVSVVETLKVSRKSALVHKRAWLKIGTSIHAAVAYCRVSSGSEPVTTTDDWGKVNCPTCMSIREGKGGL